MVPPADDKSKQHTLSTPPSHHWATISLRPADVGSVGCYNVGYDECSCTTNFETAPGRLYIMRVSDAMFPPSDDQQSPRRQVSMIMLPNGEKEELTMCVVLIGRHQEVPWHQKHAQTREISRWPEAVVEWVVREHSSYPMSYPPTIPTSTGLNDNVA